MRKMHEAKINNNPQVEIWGTGKPYRELLFVEDMADATLFTFENYKGRSFVNVGTGEDLTIKQIKLLDMKGSYILTQINLMVCIESYWM